MPVPMGTRLEHTPLASQVIDPAPVDAFPAPQSRLRDTDLDGAVHVAEVPQVEELEVVGVWVMTPAEVQAKVFVTPQVPKSSVVVDDTEHPDWQHERRLSGPQAAPCCMSRSRFPLPMKVRSDRVLGSKAFDVM